MTFRMNTSNRWKHKISGYLILSLLASAGCFHSNSELASENRIISSSGTRQALDYARDIGSISAAIEELKTKIRKKHSDVTSRLRLARLYLITGNKQEAQKQALAVKKYQFRNVESKLILANLNYMKGFHDQALLILDPLINQTDLKKKEKNEALNLMAGIAFRKGEENHSIRLLRQSLDIDPGHMASHKNLALIYIKNQEFKEAIKHLQLILNTVPDNFSTRLNLGICYAGSGDFRKARELYSKLYQEFPESGPLLFNIAVLNFREKKYDESIRYLNQYIDHAPSYYMARAEARKLLSEIQLNKVRTRGLSGNEIMKLNTRLEEGAGDSENQPISFDTAAELEAGFIFTNVGFVPD